MNSTSFSLVSKNAFVGVNTPVKSGKIDECRVLRLIVEIAYTTSQIQGVGGMPGQFTIYRQFLEFFVSAIIEILIAGDERCKCRESGIIPALDPRR